ncbi:MAG: hypothetical protein DHS20C15_22630 [Planctomycetota bacterium]|nr:MAG: hypothetical protein DHS20C15_22630 [Planctomycetota bacterium]
MLPRFPRALRWRRSLPALIALLALPALLLAPALFGDRALVAVHTGALSPWNAELDPNFVDELNPAGRAFALDKTAQFEPLLRASLERMQNGEAPLWNPNNLLGVPLLAQGFPAALHPPSWLVAWLGPVDGWAPLSWLQAVLAGLFAYLLVRELGASTLSAFVGGVTFMLGGYLSARWHWYQIHGCAAYLPLALLATERLLRGGRAGSVATLALATGLAFLTGWFQGAVHLVYAVAFWAAARWLQAVLNDKRSGSLASVGLLKLGLGLALGLALGSAQLLPALEYVNAGDSARQPVAAELIQSKGMLPHSLLTSVVPDLYGHPADLADHAVPALRDNGALRRLFAKADNNPVESSAFLGVGVIVLAMCGAGSGRRGRRLGICLAGLGALLALDTPVVRWVAQLPGLDAGDPRRFLLLMQMGFALLAAQGLHVLALLGPPRWVPIAAATAAVFFLLLTLGVGRISTETWIDFVDNPLALQGGVSPEAVAAFGEDLRLDLDLLQRALARVTASLAVVWIALRYALRWPRIGAWLLAGLVVGELSTTAARNASTVPSEQLFAPPPNAAALLDDGGGRLVRFHPGGLEDMLNIPLLPNLALDSGVRDLGGYWALAPRRAVNLLEMLEPGSTQLLGQATLSQHANLDSPLLDVLGVTRVLSSVPLTGQGLALRGRVGDAWLYARANAMPRAYFARTLTMTSEAEALERLAAPDFDPRDGALVEPIEGLEAFPLLQPEDFAAWHEVPVTIESEHFEEIVLTVDAPHPGLVVLADGYTSGWSAEVNGQAGELVWPVNHALRGVAVDSGPSRIVMRYRSRGWELGSKLTLGALLLLALLGARALRQARVEAAS